MVFLAFTLVTVGAPSDEPPANGGTAAGTRAPRDHGKPFPSHLQSACMLRRPGGRKGVVSVCLGSELLSWRFPPCRAQ